MAKKAVKLFALESLEIEKLLEDQADATSKGPEAVETFQEEATDQAVTELAEKSDDDGLDDTTGDGAGDDLGGDPAADADGATDGAPPSEEEQVLGEDPSAEDEAPAEDAPAEEDTTVAKESLRVVGAYDVSMEDVSSLMATTADNFGAAASAAYRSATWLVEGLGYLGIKYVPMALKGLYKGVLYGVVGVAYVANSTFKAVSTYVERRQNGTEALRTKLESITEALQATTGDRAAPAYRNKRVIDRLKIGESVNFAQNLDVLNKFVQKTSGVFFKAIRDDVLGLQYMSREFQSGHNLALKSVLQEPAYTKALVSGEVAGYRPTSDWVEPYHGNIILPGETVFIAELPRVTSSIENATQAYNDSKIYLGFASGNYKAVSEVPSASKADLEQLAATVGELITTLQAQEKLYAELQNLKPGLTLSLKRHLTSLVESGTRVHFSESYVQPLTLKSTFVAKVGLVGLMDLHDYTGKIVSDALAYLSTQVQKAD